MTNKYTGFNGCLETAAEALRHLAEHPRPAYGNDRFNAEHLHQIAGELDMTSEDTTIAPSISFQSRVARWLKWCFGIEIAMDVKERNHRFLEEALEVVQASGCTRSEAHQLVDYVFSRPVGELKQEYGGAMVTLMAHAVATGNDLNACGEAELQRINNPQVMEKVRAKQAAKPKHSPLPEDTAHLNGWKFSREDGRIRIEKPGVAGYLAGDDTGNLAEEVLHMLADDLLPLAGAPAAESKGVKP